MMKIELPTTLDAQGLAKLLSGHLYKAESTILRNISRRPESLPPHSKNLSRGGKKIWDTSEVLNWMFPNRVSSMHSLPEPPTLVSLISHQPRGGDEKSR